MSIIYYKNCIVLYKEKGVKGYYSMQMTCLILHYVLVISLQNVPLQSIMYKLDDSVKALSEGV